MTRFNALRSVIGNQMLQVARNGRRAAVRHRGVKLFGNFGVYFLQDILQHKNFRVPVSVFRGVYHCFLEKFHLVLEEILNKRLGRMLRDA